MSDLRNGMKSISGNDPTPEQIARVTGIAHDFDIPKNDAMFPIMVMMDQYHGIFSELPKKINDAVNSAVKSAERAADLVVGDASKKVQTIVAGSLEPLASAAFDKGVKEYITQIDGEAASAARSKALQGAIAVVAAVFVVGVLLGWGSGTWARSDADEKLIAAAAVAQGTVAGQLAQKDAETAAAIAKLKAEQAATIANLSAAKVWAGTAEGQLAYKFFTVGSGAMAAKCQAEHWTLGKSGKGEKMCVPQHEKWSGWTQGSEGWVIP